MARDFRKSGHASTARFVARLQTLEQSCFQTHVAPVRAELRLGSAEVSQARDWYDTGKELQTSMPQVV